MAAKIRLQRIGKRDQAFYRIVIIDESFKRNGRMVDLLGTYRKNNSIPILNIDKKKLEHWKSKGAMPTEGVLRILDL